MTYFVTGGTGFLGRNLIDLLLKRKGTVYVLVRAGSRKKLEALKAERWERDAERVVAVAGDLSKKNLGVSAAEIEKLKGKISHFFHLAAIYDITNENQDAQIKANVDGTRHAVQLAQALAAKGFHHTSSIAAAGLYDGYWREDMFEEWQADDHPYYRTKHDSERIVREECRIPWRIYRPGIVIGHSQTGEIDKIDGPYFFFNLILQLRRAIPQWISLLGVEGGLLNIVPVDYVTAAMDHISHKPGLDGQAFHLTNPKHNRVGEVVNIFAKAAEAPQFSIRVDSRVFGFIPPGVRNMIAGLPPVRSIIDTVLGGYGIPRQALKYFNYPTKFDNRDTTKALKGSGIGCPPLGDYAGFIWDYWERHLNPELHRDRSLAGAVSGRVVVITGATSGIGLEAARKVAAAGAKTIICARKQEELDATQAELRAAGGDVHAYSVDVADTESCDRFIAAVLKDHGHVDVLVNNAGRSIRRSVNLSYDRFHDYERTMQVNYFGALRLIMGFLPSMSARKRGHIVNILSIGVQVNQPRFSAYVASKAALGAFSRCAGPEFHHRNISFTNIYMPLVRTPMIAPTKMYDNIPTLSPDDAANMIVKGIIEKPKRIATRLGTMGELMWAAAPDVTNILFNTTYRLFPDSAAARGEKGKEGEAPSTEAVALAALTQGLHW
ncbi:SDR family oxidoreductase [Oleomonas cavernae]|uniref:SDR family oxidoreductase n=1 Tax=Oleomonas cavernae TaxID=2320859 RepID=A0A418WIM9_9PROT|nr:SDR family oxidoreductase [Oleomonas cavernae]RJF89729.1 SDR family oxidoreductase [Oleomonas cavernae]